MRIGNRSRTWCSEHSVDVLRSPDIETQLQDNYGPIQSFNGDQESWSAGRRVIYDQPTH